MLIGTECTKVSKRAVRNILAGILEIIFNAQAALAKKDRETTRLVKGYKSLCYWDARERFDPFVEYVAKELGDVTTGWFWPDPPKEKKDVAKNGAIDMLDDNVLDSLHGDFINCGMADFYHEEIMEKITGFCNDIREYYEGTPLAGTWSDYDKAIRGTVKTYRELYKSGEGYIYGYATRLVGDVVNPAPAGRGKKAKKE